MDEAVESVRREARLVASFVELADTLVEDFDVVDLLHSLTERVVELGLATDAGILLADEDGRLRVMAASQEPIHFLELLQLQNHEGPCFDCYHSGRPVRADDLADENDRWPRFVPAAAAAGVHSVLALPLRLRADVLGAMGLFREHHDGVARDDETVGQALADVATIGLLQQRGLHSAQTTSQQLRHALDSRIAIEQAKGMLAERLDVEVGDAFTIMRDFARYNNRRLSEVAHAVIDGELTTDALERRPR